MISERNKKPRRIFRRPSGRTIIILIVILIPLAIIASYIDFPATIAFVQHYFAPHNNFTYHGHTNYVGGVAWSPDGKRIASASGDDTVQVWDAFTGGHVLTYRGHSSDVVTVAWSPDGKYLASGSVDTTVQVWNATTGQHIFTYRGHRDTVFAVAWSPDGKRVASASNDGTVQEWEASTGKRIVTYSSQITAKGFPAPWNTVAWSPDGKRIAVGGMAMYKYGMLLPVGTLPTMATMVVLFTRWPGQPMGNISPAPRVILYSYGILPREKMSIRIMVIAVRYLPWRGHLMASALPLATAMVSCWYGML